MFVAGTGTENNKKRKRPDSDLSTDSTPFNKRQRIETLNVDSNAEFRNTVKELISGGFIMYVYAVTGCDFLTPKYEHLVQEEWMQDDLQGKKTVMNYIRMYFVKKYTILRTEPPLHGLRTECHPKYLWSDLMPSIRIKKYNFYYFSPSL